MVIYGHMIMTLIRLRYQEKNIRDTDTETRIQKTIDQFGISFQTTKHIIIEKGITGIGNKNFSFFIE